MYYKNYNSILYYCSPSDKDELITAPTIHTATNKMADRDALVYKAKLAEQAERFDEMVDDMKAEGRGKGSSAVDSRGEKPPECRLQERDRRPSCFLACCRLHRAKGRSREAQHHQGLQDQDRDGIGGYLQ